jgi:hypothetical protein
MSAIDILELAVGLLRGAPAAALASYLAGAVPFAIAFLFFLNDMTRSAFAFERLAAWSLALAIAYIWKNVWQAHFAARLYRTLSPGCGSKANPWRVVAMQSALQPVGLILHGIGMLIMLPLPWITAFFRNVGMFAALGSPDPVGSARKQAGLWTRQNWGIVGIASLGWLIVFVNAMIMIIALPQLGRSFLGIEGDLARLGVKIINISSIAAAASISWLLVDPLLDAVYVLRCYYGESMSTGEDLLAALKQAVGVVVLLACAVPALHAQVDPAQLDHSMDQVIHSREFTWRVQRGEAKDPDEKWISWIRAVQKGIAKGWNWVWTFIRRLFEQDQKPQTEGAEAAVSTRTMKLLIAIALALLVGAGIFFYLRRTTPAVAARPVATAAPVNVADESVTADQLPESSWLQLADELLAKGDTRLAMRALYLAGLNYLGGRGLVSIKRWKSGLDYRRELDRRSRANPAVSDEFAHVNGLFEYAWYGVHAVDRSMVESFAATLQSMRGHAER